MKNKKIKYKDGGTMNPELTGLIGTGLSVINPALGAVATPMLNMFNQENPNQVINDHFNQVKTSTNPYGYEKGGELGYEDLIKYEGNSHAEGGIPVGNTGLPSNETTRHEVEGEETSWRIGNKTYVFSNKYKI